MTPVEVGEAGEVAAAGDRVELPLAFGTMLRAGALRFEVGDVGSEVVGQGGGLVFTNGHLCAGDDPRADQFGLSFQSGQDAASGLFVTAAGRHYTDDTGTIPELGDVVRRG